jgi:hypothetical protein
MKNLSTGKLNEFYSSTEDPTLRESIRRDVLIERYVDLQEEMAHLESLLNISESENNEVLFDINEMLFELIEYLLPEINETEEIQQEAPGEPSRGKLASDRADKIKSREKKAMAISKNAEKLIRAKSNIKTARLSIKGSDSPEAKARARETLRVARSNLATAGVRAGTSRK